jgi:4-hydroxy-2-oxoheptanedioate aldolase
MRISIVAEPGLFRRRVLAAEAVAGIWCNLGSANTAEIAAQVGFDWILLDAEHGPGDETLLMHQMQAVGGYPTAPIVRIVAPEPALIGKVLDLGAAGVMVPRLRTMAEAMRVVAAMRHPPAGSRGVSRVNRATGFGLHADQYLRDANQSLLTMIQIETREALTMLDELASLDGVDVLFVGPMDLSYSLGIPGQFTHPDFLAAQQQVVAACQRAGKAAGTLLGDAAALPGARALGYTVLALGSDAGLVVAGMRQNLATLRG